MTRRAQTIRGREPFRSAAETLIGESGCVIRRWRRSNSGVAYTNADDWGIEVPEPRGPASYATFAHEVAHQTLHRHNSLPRWHEEIEAWEWSLATFDRFGLPGLNAATNDAAAALNYAISKALRRAVDKPAIAERIGGLLPSWTKASGELLDLLLLPEEGR